MSDAVEHESRRLEIKQRVDELLIDPIVQHLVNSLLAHPDRGQQQTLVRLLMTAGYIKGYNAGEAAILVKMLERMHAKKPEQPS